MEKRTIWILIVAIFFALIILTSICYLYHISQQPYSFVHISDTQFLSANHPDALNESFQYLESIKNKYNIQAIFNTGDLVDNWSDIQQWQNYDAAKSLTTIPFYEIAGNHDNNEDRDNNLEFNWTNYDKYIGADKHIWNAELNGFELIGISWNGTIDKSGLLNSYVLTNQENNTIHSFNQIKPKIIFTHDYIDNSHNGTLSPLGVNILQEFITSNTLILCGHYLKGDYFNERSVRNNIVTEDLLNHQEIDNYLVGRLYTVSQSNGMQSIDWSYIYLYPNPHIGNKTFDVTTIPIAPTKIPQNLT